MFSKLVNIYFIVVMKGIEMMASFNGENGGEKKMTFFCAEQPQNPKENAKTIKKKTSLRFSQFVPPSAAITTPIRNIYFLLISNATIFYTR